MTPVPDPQLGPGLPRACFILGNGPSLGDADLQLLSVLPVFGVNRVFRLELPRLDYYYWSDQDIWKEHEADIRALVESGVPTWCYQTHDFPIGTPVDVDVTGRVSFGRTGAIIQPGSSTMAAANLAWREGFRRFYLVGIDLLLRLGRRYPWSRVMHPNEQKHWKNHYRAHQLHNWKAISAWVDGAGGEVVSCSPTSLLNESLRHVPLEQVEADASEQAAERVG